MTTLEAEGWGGPEPKRMSWERFIKAYRESEFADWAALKERPNRSPRVIGDRVRSIIWNGVTIWRASADEPWPRFWRQSR